MPTLCRKPDGRYYVDLRSAGKGRIALTMFADGKAQPVRDEIVARAMFAEIVRGVTRATADSKDDSHDPRLRAVADYYRGTYLPARNAAAKTRAKAEYVVPRFVDWCAAHHIGRVSQVSVEVIERYAAERLQGGATARTVANHIGEIRTMIHAAHRAGLFERLPIARWPMPRYEDPEIEPLTADEMRVVLAHIEERCPEIGPICRWMALTGNRPSDAASLKFSQVDAPTLTVARLSVKARALRAYDVSRSACAIVEAERAKRPAAPASSPVFLDRSGQPWTANALAKRVSYYADGAIARKVTAHHFRDTFASIQANDLRVPLPVLRVRMGHVDISHTMRYVRATRDPASLDAWDALIGS